MYSLSVEKRRSMKTIAKRLIAHTDLKAALQNLVVEHKVRAGVLLSIVGSLSACKLRPAGGDATLVIDGPLEIVSGTGTFAIDGTMHVHISVADATGKVRGGHLLSGCLVFTTAEIVIGDLGTEHVFRRLPDEGTGHLEFAVEEAT